MRSPVVRPAPPQFHPVLEPAKREPICPDCVCRLAAYACDGKTIYKCAKCHGLWLPDRRIGTFKKALDRFDYSELEIFLYPADDDAYRVSACHACREVLEEFRYAYNTGVLVYRCARCEGLWLPLREMVNLVRSTQLSHTLQEDVRGFVSEMAKLNGELWRMLNFKQILRRLLS